MAIATANRFWVSLSPQLILKGNVGFNAGTELGSTSAIKAENDLPPFQYNTGFRHPVLPKFQNLYLNVSIRSEKSINNYYYDNLRKSVLSDYCNYYYDSDKYVMKLITSSHDTINDSTQITLLSTLLSDKKLYRVLDIYITDIVDYPEVSGQFKYNVKIRYLEKK